MISLSLRRIISSASAVVLLTLAGTASAQFNRLKIGSVSVGGTGEFSKILEQNGNAVTNPTTGVVYSNQRQDTTWSAGFLTSVQLNPVSWAGVELNYGYTHYQERYSYNAGFATNPTATLNETNVTTDRHEATAAYIFHAKRLPLRPYVGIGGGALDFDPYTQGNHQWRGAGLLETGFDIPTHTARTSASASAGRSLYYRSPNFGNSYGSLHAQLARHGTEPAVSCLLPLLTQTHECSTKAAANAGCAFVVPAQPELTRALIYAPSAVSTRIFSPFVDERRHLHHEARLQSSQASSLSSPSPT